LDRIFLSTPDMSELERELLLEAFDSNWIAPVGPQIDAFEKDFASLLDVEHAVALSSGTAALHLALILLGIGPDDDVIVPTMTFVATANAVTYAGARPVFVDSEATTWNLDPNLLEEELQERANRGIPPAAVIVVDVFGQCADYDSIQEVCARFDVPIIEDAAEALGASYRGRPAGTFGEMAAFSFNGNKIVTTSGGGMLVTNRGDWAERARYLATQARSDAPHYEHVEIGFNYRLSNLCAAVGRGQLQRLPEKVARCQEINRRYRAAFADLPGIDFMPDAPTGRPTNWLTVATIDESRFGASPETVRQRLAFRNITARPAWKPMHLQPVFADAPRRGGAVAEQIFRSGLCLPGGSAMVDADLERVVAAVRSVAEGAAGERRSTKA
jgi:dTDP-4-amino-4,6-dideoxygalactose transaminase